MDNNHYKMLSDEEKERLGKTIWNFCSAFANTKEFKTFETTFSKMNKDAVAQKDLQIYQQKQQEINQNYRQHGDREKTVSEMNSLQESLIQNKIISDYTSAQEELMALCQEAGDILSQASGLNYAAVCAPSCCG